MRLTEKRSTEEKQKDYDEEKDGEQAGRMGSKQAGKQAGQTGRQERGEVKYVSLGAGGRYAGPPTKAGR